MVGSLEPKAGGAAAEGTEAADPKEKLGGEAAAAAKLKPPGAAGEASEAAPKAPVAGPWAG